MAQKKNMIYRQNGSRGSSSWIVRWRDNNRVMKSKAFNDKKYGNRTESYNQAVAFLKTIEADLVKGDYIDPHQSKITLDDFKHEVGITKASHENHTIETLENVYNEHIASHHLANKSVGSITANDISQLIKGLEKANGEPYSRSLIVKVYLILKVLLREAVEMDYLRKNPADTQLAKKWIPKNAKKKKTYLDRFKVNAIYKQVDKTHPQYSAVVQLLAYTGLRSGEFRALEWADIDWNNATVSVSKTVEEVGGKIQLKKYPKTKSSTRVISIDKITLNILREHKEKFQQPNCELIFPDKNCINAIRGNNFKRRILFPACDEIGMERINLHDFRHTSVRLARESGADIHAISKRLGHSTIGLTSDTYSELFEDIDQELVKGLEELQRDVI